MANFVKNVVYEKPNMNYVNQRLSLMEDKFMKTKPLRVYCGTFNVNGKLPDESLRPWLFADHHNPIDIFALGFQELVDLSTRNLFLASDGYEREQYWINLLNNDMQNENNFRSRAKYKLVGKVRMFGLFLVVYANESLLQKKDCIKEICYSSVATGIMDMVGNKGSVGVSMKVYESRICFVCSHFGANTDQLE